MAEKGTKGIFDAQLDVEHMSGTEDMAPRSVCLQAAHVDWGRKRRRAAYTTLPGNAMHTWEIAELYTELQDLREEVQALRGWASNVTQDLKELQTFTGWQTFLQWLWGVRASLSSMLTWSPFLNWMWLVRNRLVPAADDDTHAGHNSV